MESTETRKTRTSAMSKKNLFLRDLIIVFICVLGMGGSLWFFRQGLLKSKEQLNKKPVGAVYWVNNNVKRLSNDRLQWEKLERFSYVYDRDTISTAALSDARINFTNGEILELAENTSVIIKYLNQEIFTVDLRAGEIEIQGSHLTMAVSAPAAAEPEASATRTANSGYTVNLDPRTSAGIKISENLNIKIYQGSGTVISKGKYLNIAAGETLRSDSSGNFSQVSPVTVSSPRNGTILFRNSQEAEKVKFEWRKSRSQVDSNVTLEISETRDFSRITASRNWENTESGEIELSPGTYYWKLFPSSSRENFDSGHLNIIETNASLALSPSDGSVVRYAPGKRELRFSWAVPAEAEAVLLEVADNPEMTRPRLMQLIKRTKNGTGTYKSTELGAGKWYWRIHPVFNNRISEETLYSAVNSFTFDESTGQPESSRRPKTVAAETAVTDFRNIYPPDSFTLEVNRTPDLLFTWKSPIRQINRFQITENLDFTGSMVINEEVYGSNFQCRLLKPGIYYWRVTGDKPGDSGTPTRLVVIPMLSGPALVTPTENETLRILDETPVTFRWRQVDYANSYIFSLFVEGREQALREVSSIQSDSVMVYFDHKTMGRFRWTVQGYAPPTETVSRRAGLVSHGNFNVNLGSGSAGGDPNSWTIPRIANMQSFLGEVDSPIRLLAPVSGVNVSGIQALRVPLQARWESDEPLRNIKLIVSRTTDPLSDPRAIVKYTSGTTTEFPPLSEGIWYWIIQADTIELNGITPGDPYWINVRAIPQLPSPGAIQPANESVIDLEQLTRDRNITFRWNPVDSANAYIFSLYRDETTPSLLLSSAPQGDLSYILSNLSILADGKYFWQVEAVVTNRSGVIEQRGAIVQHPFIIAIQRSSGLQTKRVGEVYGQ